MVEVATIGEDELARLVAVHNGVRPDDPVTVREFVDWKRQADDMVWLVAEAGNEDVGAGIGIVGWHLPPQTAIVEAWTLPDARGRGVGSSLYADLRRWSAEHGCLQVNTRVAEDDEASIAWAERRGFSEVGRDSRLVLMLDSIETPAIDPPDGTRIVTWAEHHGIERGMYEVFLEAAPDVPGEEHNELPAYERWLSNDMQGLADRPEAVFAAMVEDEVVGYAKLSLPDLWTGDAFHDLTAVKRAWRGRGIAGALKRTQIAWAKEHGYRRLVTRNEERNEPIRRLNMRYGYRLEPGHVFLQASLVD